VLGGVLSRLAPLPAELRSSPRAAKLGRRRPRGLRSRGHGGRWRAAWGVRCLPLAAADSCDWRNQRSEELVLAIEELVLARWGKSGLVVIDPSLDEENGCSVPACSIEGK
jgi:hypothetical protein